MLEAGAGEAVVETAEGLLLSVALVDDSGMDEPVPSLELLLDANVETLV